MMTPSAPARPDGGPGAASRPDVSVVIPAWNAARWLERAVRSALDQAGPSVEVIVVDDASTDGTAEAAERLAALDPSVRVLRAARNGGPAAARNRGFDQARGAWVAVLDADDAFAPGRLARLTAIAAAEELDAVSDLPRLFDLAAGRPGPTQLPADGSLEVLDLRRLLETAAGRRAGIDLGLLKPMISRRLLDRGLWRYPEGVRHGEDFLAAYEALAAGARFGLLHEAHYVFSTRLGETSGAWSPGSVTQVDYRAVAANTDRLIARLRRDHPALPGLTAEEAAALLAERRLRLRELDRFYGWTTLRKRAWKRHWDWLRRDPRNPGALAAMLLRNGTAALRRRLPGAG